MYTKDITFLLRLLGSSKQSGVLLVEAPGPNESPWQGRFQLNNGVVTSCVLLNKADGRTVLRNEEALAWITGQGKLEWKMEEDTEGQPLLPPPRLPASTTGTLPRAEPYEEIPTPAGLGKNQLEIVPQRTQKGTMASGNAFASREHRQILGLVDGQRTLQEIAQLLHRPPEFILHVLQELQAAGFIT